jgi:hypothetical protein
VVDGNGLENRRAGNGAVGSNPTPSARWIVELFSEVKDNERGRKGLLKALFCLKGSFFSWLRLGLELPICSRKTQNFGTF